MAAVDDIYNEITRNSRKRTGRSFFPAANVGPGQIIQMSGEGSAYSGAQTGGYGPGRGALPPDQNPAYQAAIAKGRPDRSAYSWITTPSGGQMRVPTSSINALVREGTALSGSYVNPPTGPLTQQQYASNYAKGYGAPAPSFNPGTGTLANKGVETPVEQLNLQQRSVLPGANPFLQQWGSNFAANNPKLAAFGTLAANIYKGLQQKANTPAASQYANNVSTGQVPSQPPTTNTGFGQAYYNYNPSPAPPRRYSDLGYY